MSKSWMMHVVDDDEPVRTSLSFMLEAVGYRVATYVDAANFLARQAAERGVMISDVRMPGMSGIELTRLLKLDGVKMPVILITGHSSPELRMEAMSAGADSVLEKPVELAELLAEITRVTDRAERNHFTQPVG